MKPRIVAVTAVLTQEFFSRAYALAVVSAAGYNYNKPEFDVGVDFTITGASFDVPSPYPSIQETNCMGLDVCVGLLVLEACARFGFAVFYRLS